MNETSAPSFPHPDEQSRTSIHRMLAPVRRAIGLARIARYALIGLAIGAGAGGLLVLSGYLWRVAHARPAGAGLAALGLLLGVALGIVRWPRALEAARAADRHFDLRDRLTTALELDGSHDPLAKLQRRDVARRTEGLPLRRSRGRWIEPRTGAICALVLAAFAGALALGAPGRLPRGVQAASNRDVRRIHHAAKTQVRQITAKLNTGLTTPQRQEPAMQRLNVALARLQRQLLHASSRQNALRAVSLTQQQLHQIAAGLHPISSKAAAQLNGALHRYLNGSSANQHAGSTGHSSARTSARSAASTARALQRLAQTLAHMTPAQRAALARALARAANRTSDTSLRSSLQQAASSLASNQPQSAQSALQQAAQALAQSPNLQAALARLNAAGSQLTGLKNQIAGLNASQSTGQPGTASPGSQGASKGKVPGLGRGLGSRPGSGHQPGQGQGPGRGLGSRPGTGAGRGLGARQGQGTGKGLAAGRGSGGRRGTGAGRGTGRGRGQGTAGRRGANGRAARGAAGAHGRGAGRGQSSKTGTGRKATVFVPGVQGKGPQTIQTGPNGAPLPGAIVPYQQVVVRYARSAHAALDRASLPPTLQDYVRRYFSAVSR